MSDNNTISYAALRARADIAVEAMMLADNMWSINSISRLKRAWAAAIDALEVEVKRSVEADVARASRELSGRADGK